MRVSKQDAVAIMEELGWGAAPGWSDDKLETRLNALVDQDEEALVVRNNRLRDILDEMLDDLRTGNHIEITKQHVPDNESQDDDSPGADEHPLADDEGDDEDRISVLGLEDPEDRPAKHTQTKPKPTKAKRSPKKVSSGKNSKTRGYWAGHLIAKRGTDITSDSFIDDLTRLCGNNNRQQAAMSAKLANEAIEGYLSVQPEDSR